MAKPPIKTRKRKTTNRQIIKTKRERKNQQLSAQIGQSKQQSALIRKT